VLFIHEISKNQVLMVAITAWIIAQSLKIFLFLVIYKRFNFRRFIESGGMPSSHSALVSSLTTAVGKIKGWDSTVTAVVLVFALIVMYDATGVRRAAGKQAKVLNKIIDEFLHKRGFGEERLKELIGHTPFEVIVGSLLGIFVAVIMV